jgi:hypothetical protein
MVEAAALHSASSKGNEHSATASDSQTITIPAIVSGTIGHPGDIDTFSFQVKTGESLAFEIETPDLTPPQFNPLLSVLDKQGRQILTNVYMRVGRIPNYRKTVQPKSLWTFKTGGEFRLQIQDVTSRYGNSGFRYRVMVRPQIPHLGEVHITEEAVKMSDMTRVQLPIDRINLHLGVPKRITIQTDLEEGFVGNVVLRVEGLPAGVEVLPESQIEPDHAVVLDEGERDVYLPRLSKASLVLLANTTTPVLSTPQLVRISAQPVLWNNTAQSNQLNRSSRLPSFGREISLLVVDSGNENL